MPLSHPFPFFSLSLYCSPTPPGPPPPKKKYIYIFIYILQPHPLHPHQWLSQCCKSAFSNLPLTPNTLTHPHLPALPPHTHHRQQLTAFPNHLATSHHFRFRSSGNPAFSCPPHFLVLSLIYSLLVSPIILHTTHTLFCRKVHNPNSRSRCCLAGERTQNLRAILLLCLIPSPTYPLPC